MNVLLIEASEGKTNVFSAHTTLPRIGLPILGSIAERKGHNVRILNPRYTKLSSPFSPMPDLVGISCTSASFQNALKIADKFKETKVVLGGMHATFGAKNILKESSAIDIIVRGEGEIIFENLLMALKEGKSLKNVSGISYRDGSYIVENPPERLILNLDTTPNPKWELVKDIRFSVYPVQTTRGCPYPCDFCSVTAVFGKRYRYKSIEKVIHEMEEIEKYKEMGIFNTYYKKEGKDLLFFYDDNFAPQGKSNRERTKELIKKLMEKGLLDRRKRKWVAQTDVHIGKDTDILDFFMESGCIALYQGFESPNEDALKELNKRQTKSDMEITVREAHKRGIKVHAMFIVGGESDSYSSFGDIIRFAKKVDLDILMMYFLTPFPGTKIFEKYKDRIIDPSFKSFDLNHVCLNLKHLKPSKLQRMFYKNYKEFYSFRYIFKSFLNNRNTDLLRTRLAAKLIIHLHHISNHRFIKDLERKGL